MLLIMKIVQQSFVKLSETFYCNKWFDVVTADYFLYYCVFNSYYYELNVVVSSYSYCLSF